MLIGWDAAEWQVIHPLLDAGLMPNLQRLVEGGVIGNLASLSPMLSPILWTSIATGKRAYAHGIHGFVEPLPDRSGVRPVGTATRQCKALWNILSQENRPSVVCGWQASHPAEPIRGVMVSNVFALPTADATPNNWPVPQGSVQPAKIGTHLAELRVHPFEIEGGMLQQLIPRAAELDQSDPLVRRRLMILAERMSEVINVHSVATELLENQSWDFGAIYYECIDQVGHEFMSFHPPRLSQISESDFGFYKDVMSGIYQFHDLMLARLLQIAGPDVHVMIVSDHGFQSGARRPLGPVEPAQWHRPQGIFVLHGPGIRADARVEGATLLDVAPTALTLLGLPVGEDMEGKVLVSAFDDAPEIERITSWEKVAGDDGRAAGSAEEMSSEAAQAVLQQFIALGYIAPPDEDAKNAVALAEREANFNLAVSLSEGGRANEAQELLISLTSLYPDEPRYWRVLAQTSMTTRSFDVTAQCLAALEKLEPQLPQTIVLRGLLAWSKEDFKACLSAFREAEKIAPDDPITLTYLGRLYLRQRQWPNAERAFYRVLELDPDSAEAHYGLSVALPRQNRVEEGIDHALLAVGLRHEFPEAHFQLGALLSRLGWYERAVQAFEISLRMRPGFALAHGYLTRIYGRIGRVELANHHRNEVARLRESRAAQPIAD